MTDTEDAVEDEEVTDDEEIEDLEPTADDLVEATTPPDPAAAEVESIQELLVKQEARSEQAEAPDEEDETLATGTAKGERLEPVDTKVVPIQATEFVCKKCYLVKHRSQLADKKKMLCRDCA
ncbi:MAG: hypothetical protein QOI81_1413 [Actinomycetota bacterium]|jgi:hypothetical protein|nr:hypothetical protein [Actinomycetota bacterium]